METRSFSRRRAISIVRTRHELRRFSAQEDTRERCALEIQLQPGASWETITRRWRELAYARGAARDSDAPAEAEACRRLTLEVGAGARDLQRCAQVLQVTARELRELLQADARPPRFASRPRIVGAEVDWERAR